MPSVFTEEMHRLWNYFDSGVKEAIAENERLGITSDEASLNSPVDTEPAEAPLVSEKDAE